MVQNIDGLVREAGRAIGVEVARQAARHIDNLPESFPLNPTDGEVVTALGGRATPPEINAYRKGHQAGLKKGLLIGVAAVLAAVGVLVFKTAADTAEDQ